MRIVPRPIGRAVVVAALVLAPAPTLAQLAEASLEQIVVADALSQDFSRDVWLTPGEYVLAFQGRTSSVQGYAYVIGRTGVIAGLTHIPDSIPEQPEWMTFRMDEAWNVNVRVVSGRARVYRLRVKVHW